jgi:hypothetical protein
LEKFNLRYVPYSLESDQKRSRVELSWQLLQRLEQRSTIWLLTYINRGRKLVLFEYFHHSRWAANPDEVPEIPKQTVQSEKCLVSIMWGSTGIKSLLYVPKSMKYNTTSIVKSVVPNLVEHVCQESWRQTLRDIMVHLDNARPHNNMKSEAALTATKAGWIPTPDYSSDSSPSDFFLFGMLKERMSETSYSSPDELISAISEPIASLPKD